jgi:hypothetical protein
MAALYGVSREIFRTSISDLKRWRALRDLAREEGTRGEEEGRRREEGRREEGRREGREEGRRGVGEEGRKVERGQRRERRGWRAESGRVEAKKKILIPCSLQFLRRIRLRLLFSFSEILQKFLNILHILGVEGSRRWRVGEGKEGAAAEERESGRKGEGEEGAAAEEWENGWSGRGKGGSSKRVGGVREGKKSSGRGEWEQWERKRREEW